MFPEYVGAKKVGNCVLLGLTGTKNPNLKAMYTSNRLPHPQQESLDPSIETRFACGLSFPESREHCPLLLVYGWTMLTLHNWSWEPPPFREAPSLIPQGHKKTVALFNLARSVLH